MGEQSALHKRVAELEAANAALERRLARMENRWHLMTTALGSAARMYEWVSRDDDEPAADLPSPDLHLAAASGSGGSS